jgi:hypothetical protein
MSLSDEYNLQTKRQQMGTAELGLHAAHLVCTLLLIGLVSWNIDLSRHPPSPPLNTLSSVLPLLSWNDRMRDHIQQTINYLIFARVPCDRAAGEVALNQLSNTMQAFGVALGNVADTDKWMTPHLVQAKRLFDASLPCPCNGGGFFGPCNNATVAAEATQQLLSNARDWARFVARQTGQSEARILASWNEHLMCTVAYLQAAVQHGVESPAFQSAANGCLNKGMSFATAVVGSR